MERYVAIFRIGRILDSVHVQENAAQPERAARMYDVSILLQLPGQRADWLCFPLKHPPTCITPREAKIRKWYFCR